MRIFQLNHGSLFASVVLVMGFVLIDARGVRDGMFGLGQSAKRTVDERADPAEPIENLGIIRSGQLTKLSEQFDNGDDWLKGVSIRVRNKSDRTIVYVQTGLAFFETQPSGSILLFDALRYGRRPWVAEDASKSPLQLEPGATVDLPITDQTYNSLKSFAARKNRNISDFHRATLRLSMVIFDDGTAWSLGSFRCPDPNQPGNYVAIKGRKCP
jgi:hypothetical protein